MKTHDGYKLERFPAVDKAHIVIRTRDRMRIGGVFIHSMNITEYWSIYSQGYFPCDSIDDAFDKIVAADVIKVLVG